MIKRREPLAQDRAHPVQTLCMERKVDGVTPQALVELELQSVAVAALAAVVTDPVAAPKNTVQTQLALV